MKKKLKETKVIEQEKHNSVLIIDDDETAIKIFEEIFKPLPYELKISKNRDEALLFLEKIHPKGVILSVDIKKGWNICSKIKRDKNLKTIPLLLTSSKVSGKTFEEHKKLPIRADAYLHKPIDKNTFISSFFEIVGETDLEKPVEFSFEEIPERTILSPEVVGNAVIAYVEDEIKSLKEVIDELSKEKERLNGKIQFLEEELEHERNKIDSQLTSIRESSQVSEKIDLLKEESEKLRAEINILKAKENSLIKEKEELISKISKEESEKNELFLKLENMNKELNKLKTENNALKDEIETRTSLFSRLEEGYKETTFLLEENNKILTEERDSLLQKLQKIEKENSALLKEFEKARLNMEKKEEIENLISEINRLKKYEDENLELKEEVKRLKEFEPLQFKIGEYEREKKELLLKIEEINSERDTLINALREKEFRILELEGQINEIKAKFDKIKNFFSEFNF